MFPFTQFQDSISFSDVTTHYVERYIFVIQYIRNTVHLIKDVIAYSRKLLNFDQNLNLHRGLISS